MRTKAMVHKALFTARSPLQIRGCRTVLPDDVCCGLVLQSAASAASLFQPFWIVACDGNKQHYRRLRPDPAKKETAE